MGIVLLYVQVVNKYRLNNVALNLPTFNLHALSLQGVTHALGPFAHFARRINGLDYGSLCIRK